MNYRISGLSSEPFEHLYGLSDAQLAEHGAKRYTADKSPCFPDRIEMRDAKVGETLILLNHQHQPVDSPYQSSHAIFVLEGAKESYEAVNEVPEVMRCRLIALRGFNDEGMILEADVATGDDIEGVIKTLFANPDVSYIHAHNAKQGCFSGRIDRV